MTWELIGDAITRVGSLVGLAAGLFLLYDRLIRGRPALSLFRRPVGHQAQACLRISNNDDSDLLIDRIICSPSGHIRIAINDSAAEVARSAITPQGVNQPIHIWPRKQAFLPMFVDQSADADAKVTIRAHWQRSAKAWPFPRWSTIVVTPALVRRIEDAKSVSRDEDGGRT